MHIIFCIMQVLGREREKVRCVTAGPDATSHGKLRHNGRRTRDSIAGEVGNWGCWGLLSFKEL